LERGDRNLKEGIYFKGRDSSRVISKFIKDVAMIEINKYKIVQSGPEILRGHKANIPFQH
jgi:hypothetical protein